MKEPSSQLPSPDQAFKAALAQRPSIGRIVHFHEEGGPYPAMIVKVHEEQVDPDNGSPAFNVTTCDLVTFGPRSVMFQHGKTEAREAPPAKGSWTWPPRT